MQEIAAIIVLYSIVKLTAYGVWNAKNDKNTLAAVGTAIIDAAIIIYFITLIIKIFG
ncbi:MAG: hypothetical protein J6N52_12915 [Clostridia bacterium]|nr:hypothetical protein [Clostridia bacterium]